MSIAARRMQRAAQVTVSGGGNPTDGAGSLAVGEASYAVPGDAIYVATDGNDTTGTGLVGAPIEH
ncbi:hypothetical protein IPL68_04420 [Candidatus Saccharibacteria bacterium]|nr:MAG: hypothetical protein IPL68_04420 [Candidatus Saccharibacteria bacterium]